MRALIRTRLLAALCAMLLVVSLAGRASAFTKPIDRAETPPDIKPLQVGDPDEPHGMILIVPSPWGFVVLHVRWISLPLRASTSPRVSLPLQRSGVLQSSRGGHAH